MGKAKELRKRVSSYFRRSGTPHGRTPEMLVQACDIEWVVTASEGEALLLEDNFIKESRPPFNLRLRDDKSYPFIEITSATSGRGCASSADGTCPATFTSGRTRAPAKSAIRST